jgi:hypothetical protein
MAERTSTTEGDRNEPQNSDPTQLQRALQDGHSTHPAIARLVHNLGKLDGSAISAYPNAYSRHYYSRSCFPAGTAILLADGTSKQIEQITVGDVVMGFDGSCQVPVCVEELESPLRDHLCVLSFADGSRVELTQEHPLFTKEGWRSVSPRSTAEENADLTVAKLEIGDGVLTAAGAFLTLTDISFVRGQVQTYNIKRLAPHNNFYVNGFLVHSKASTYTANLSSSEQRVS